MHILKIFSSSKTCIQFEGLIEDGVQRLGDDLGANGGLRREAEPRDELKNLVKTPKLVLKSKVTILNLKKRI